MKYTFQHQLNIELLLSERRRTLILITIFVLAIIYRLCNMLVFHTFDDLPKNSFSTALLFPGTIITFELFCFLYITRRLRTTRKKIPTFMQYLNTAIETCLPSVVIFLFARQFPAFNVMQSPAVSIYFVFIILSTLRLNFWLSCFCGVLSSGSFVFLNLYLYDHFDSSDATRAFIIFFCGLSSGLVARQIRRGVSKSLREAEKRQKVENIFGRQLSTEIAEKMLENDGKIESKRMNVAVMFIDIRNFSNFAADKKPEEIVKYQNDFFAIVINTISRFSGIVHQFLGDGCMITFGAPIPLGNPSDNAVRAAITLLKELEQAVQERNLIQTRIGIGIHCGQVVTGNIGTAQRQQYSITGNVVILASRIEQLNKQYASELLVSEDVIDNLDITPASARCHGHVALKGWHKPVAIYQLV